MGYGSEPDPAYVRYAHKDELQYNECMKLIDEADLVIIGSAPDHMIKERLRRKKLVFRYAERPLRHGPQWHKYIPRLIRWHRRNPMSKPIHLLCASAYTSGDYARFGLFRKRAYQWGYFTETKRYDVKQLFQKKDPMKVLMVARLLPLKHPDDALAVIKRLREEGYPVSFDIIGIGPMEQKLRQMVSQWQLEDCVHLLGAMKPEQVRQHMEQAGVFVFASDRQEGWGAVLNESMNSGCAVVASHAIGAVPYLIEDGKNGCIYRSGDVEMLYEKVKALLDDSQRQQAMGLRAYETITGLWNAEVAAERLCRLTEAMLSGNLQPDLYESGPCSRAPRLSDDWM